MIRREIPELYGHLPVELFVTPSGHYAFDASQVAFLDLDRITFDILTCLRQEHCSVEELAARLPEYEMDAIVEALAAIEAAQADGWMKPYAFRRTDKDNNRQRRAVDDRRPARRSSN